MQNFAERDADTFGAQGTDCPRKTCQAHSSEIVDFGLPFGEVYSNVCLGFVTAQ